MLFLLYRYRADKFLISFAYFMRRNNFGKFISHYPNISKHFIQQLIFLFLWYLSFTAIALYLFSESFVTLIFK